MNALGSADKADDNDQYAYPTSARLYYAYHYGGATDPHNPGVVSPGYGGPDYLAVGKQAEFRGHALVDVVAPDRSMTRHYFYQGNLTEYTHYTAAFVGDPNALAPGQRACAQADLTPTAGTDPTVYETQPCFVQLRDNEFRRGREYRTEVVAPGGALLARTDRTDTVLSQVYGPGGVTGVWGSWTVMERETASAFEGASSPATKTTRYTYRDAALHPTTFYDVQAVEEDDGAGAAYRTTRYIYGGAADPVGTANRRYFDRLAQAEVSDGAGTVIGRAQYFYDGMTTLLGVGQSGDLTWRRTFFDIPAGRVTDVAYGYDGYGNRTRATTYPAVNGYGVAGGRTTTTTYDPTYRAFPLSVTGPAPTSTSAGLTETAHYNGVDVPITGYSQPFGTLARVLDPNGAERAAFYDKFGRPTAIVEPGDTPAAPTAQLAYYDYASAVAPAYAVATRRVNAATAARTVVFWDGRGRTLQTKRESGADQAIAADAQYHPDPREAWAGQARATAGSLFVWSPPDMNVRWTKTRSDALGRATLITAPDATITSRVAYGATATGTTTTTTDPNGHATTRASDVFGRLVGVTEPLVAGPNGAATAYAYDALDRPTTRTDALGNVATTAYGSTTRGPTVTATDPDRGTETAQRDAVGRTLVTTDGNGATVSFGYDDLDRVVTQTDDGQMATFTYDETASFDGAGPNAGRGRLTATNSPQGSATSRVVYDARGRAIRNQQTIQGVAVVATTEYDNAGRVIGATYPDGERVTTTYDLAGRPTGMCGAVCYAHDAQYTPLDQPTAVTLGNGLGERWAYDPLMQRLAEHQVGTGATPGGVDDRTYTYDPVGNVATIQNPMDRGPNRPTRHFAYDARDRLTHAWTTDDPGGYDETDGYDAIGNLVTKGGVAYNYPASGAGSVRPHAVTAVAGGATSTCTLPGQGQATTFADYRYDNAGNTLGGGGRCYTWNALGLPTSITSGAGPVPVSTTTPNLAANRIPGPTVPGAPNRTANRTPGPTVSGMPNLTEPLRPPNTAGATETYAYDASGARVARNHDGMTTLYFGSYEVDRVGTTTLATRSFYAFGGGVVAQREVKGAATTLPYLHSDHLGGVSVATDGGGVVLSRQEYDAWGKVRSGGVSQTTVNYTGQKKDGTGLLYYGARYYDPQLGRFLSADSVGVSLANPQSLNRYSYVGNNPLNHTDPTGQCEDTGSCGKEDRDHEAGDGSYDANGRGYSEYDNIGDDPAYDHTRDSGAYPLESFGGGFNGDFIPYVPPTPSPPLITPNDGPHKPPPLITTGCQYTNSCGPTSYITTGCQYTNSCGSTTLGTPHTGPSTGGIYTATGECSLDPEECEEAGGENSEALGKMTPPGAQGGVYTLRDPQTGEVKYVGRTNDLDRRRNEHAGNPEKASLIFTREYETNEYNEQRGLEKYLYDKYNPPLNRVKPVSDKNPNIGIYTGAADRYRSIFG